MKLNARIFKFLSMAVFFILFSAMCSDDEDNDDDGGGNNTQNNHFTFDGEEYQLEAGLLLDYGNWEGDLPSNIYNFDIVLITTQITTNNGELIPVDNTYSEVYFEVLTDNPSELDTGNYDYSDNQNYSANTFSDNSDIMINYNIESDGEESWQEMTSGTLRILDNGSTYELEFEGNAGGQAFEGYYKGSLQYIDDSARMAMPNKKHRSKSIKL